MSEDRSRKNLPPLVAKDSSGGLEWQSIEEIDYDTLGYFLSCHLIIEHYIDNVLKSQVKPSLGWDEARLTFSQKVKLLDKSNFFKEDYDYIPSIKHLNKLRNKISHNISFKLSRDDFIPLIQQLEKHFEKSEVPENIHDILEFYTMHLCSYCAGAIAQSDIARRDSASNT